MSTEHTLQLHLKSLASLCRICGERGQKERQQLQRKAKHCKDFRLNLKHVFGIDIDSDHELTHPKLLCETCYNKSWRLQNLPPAIREEKIQEETRIVMALNCKWKTYQSSSSVENCFACQSYLKRSKGGRPFKKTKNQGFYKKSRKTP